VFVCAHLDLEQFRGARVAPEQSPHPLGHGDRRLHALLAARRDRRQAFRDAPLESIMHRPFLRPPRRTAADDEHLLTVGRGA
jgi:hypothetical protein